RAREQPSHDVLRRLSRDVERDALLAGVVPPVIEAAIGVALVVDERAAPPPRTAIRRLDLDHPGASVGEQLARPLVAAIRQLDHREAVVHPAHLSASSVNASVIAGGASPRHRSKTSRESGQKTTSPSIRSSAAGATHACQATSVSWGRTAPSQRASYT